MVKTVFTLKKWGLFQDLEGGFNSGTAVREVGSERGAAGPSRLPAVNASPHRFTQVYERRSRLARGFFRAHAHDRGALEKGAARQGCSPGAPRWLRASSGSESPSPGRALQAPSPSAGFQRKFVVFLFRSFSLSLFPPIGTKKNQSRTSFPKEEEPARHWRISIRAF